MAIKRNSPINGRAPSVLPLVQDDELTSCSSSASLCKERDRPDVESDRGAEESSSSSDTSSTPAGSQLMGKLRVLPMDLVFAAVTWFLIGMISICTTKLLLMDEFSTPPLVLTLQQTFLGSCLLRLYLGSKGAVQPLPPWNELLQMLISSSSQTNQYAGWRDLMLAGLFNALDFLASNTSFSQSSASFVETIKASEPMTTTAIALAFGIDRLRLPEAASLGILISGVFCSTIGNISSSENNDNAETTSSNDLHQSVKTCFIVMTANICFAFRAKSQKIFRSHPEGQSMNDANLLMRMQQIGAMSLLLPVIIFELPGVINRTMETPMETQLRFLGLTLINASAFCTYSLASCYVLTKISVVQHTGLGCVRRMCAIIFTSIAFGVPITPLGGLGIMMCFCGFCSFSYCRISSNSK